MLSPRLLGPVPVQGSGMPQGDRGEPCFPVTLQLEFSLWRTFLFEEILAKAPFQFVIQHFWIPPLYVLFSVI
jgi:hypothetical protein